MRLSVVVVVVVGVLVAPEEERQYVAHGWSHGAPQSRVLARTSRSGSASGGSRRWPPPTTTTALLATTTTTRSPPVRWEQFGAAAPPVEEVWMEENCIGSGSYGVVHMCRIRRAGSTDYQWGIAKRAWTAPEVLVKNDSSSSSSAKKEQWKQAERRAQRCQELLKVEYHCLSQVQEETLSESLNKNGIVQLWGWYNQTWMVTQFLARASTTEDDDDASSSSSSSCPQPARTLAQVLQKGGDTTTTEEEEEDSFGISNRLRRELWGTVSKRKDALPSSEQVMDHVWESLLQSLVHIHSHDVVHRDIKPQNILCHAETQSLILIDFGSAADLQKSKGGGWFGGGGAFVGLDDRVAVSPIYAAPEVFIDMKKNPLSFDVFSAALVLTQVAFSLVDERTDAAFRKQLEMVDFDLNVWLSKTLSTQKVRPLGLDHALDYFSQRPGLWRLLQEMLERHPEKRITSAAALTRFQSIRQRATATTTTTDDDKETDLYSDGPFFESVVEYYDSCDLVNGFIDWNQFGAKATQEASRRSQRHFVATFERQYPLGLILAEANQDDDDENASDWVEWKKATMDAKTGEVFVRDIQENGQAQEMGIFQVGDRLRAVGEIPVGDGGFERVVEMLHTQPQAATTVRLHFDREISMDEEEDAPPTGTDPAKVIGSGSCSVRGRRFAQEDRIVLDEVPLPNGGRFLFGGVFDGHCGDAASTACADLIPRHLHNGVSTPGGQPQVSASERLLDAWNTACETYRQSCDDNGGCEAEYDPVEGTLQADTGSTDLVAGTTGAMVALEVDSHGVIHQVAILNCGDSRSLVVGGSGGGAVSAARSRDPSHVVFETRDHCPSDDLEAARLLAGRDAGLDYAMPECSLSRWWLTVGNCQYAVSRSLEGSMATLKGIVSTADMTTLAVPGERQLPTELGTIVVASDGLFEVMDNEEVARAVLRLRREGKTSEEAAKSLCKRAYDKGSRDNISVVLFYLL